MVAFKLFWWPIYWYWLFYLITFFSWYMLLYFLPRSSFFSVERQKAFPQLYRLLRDKLDDIFFVLMLWVILWWRLWHVIFYDLWYYLNNLWEILLINQWGMSFVGWILWVVVWLFYLLRRYKLTWNEMKLFGDFILLVVPLGSLLWRIWNFLNQELIWKSLMSFEMTWWALSTLAFWFQSVGLTTVYTAWDNVERINVNYIQSALEGWLLLLLVWFVFFRAYRKNDHWTPAGYIAWWYLIGYACVRFFVEFFKDLPDVEVWWFLSVSQWLTVWLFVAWAYFLKTVKKESYE